MRRTRSSIDGKTENGAILGADLAYEYTISESATLSERLLLESGDENTYTESETALKTRIKGSPSAKLSYLVKHNSTVPAGIENSDHLTTISLVYGY